MIATAPATREALAQAHPEWAGWLRLLDAAAVEARAPAWRHAARGARLSPSADAPMLAGAIITVDRDAADLWTRRVLEIGAGAGDAGAPLAGAARSDALDVEALLEAAVVDDAAGVDAAAATLGVPAAPLRAVAPIVVMPLLQALARDARPAAQAQRGWCPTCGAWPALIEARGVERERRLRCARCGGDWTFDWLRCPFCDTRDHARLAGLATETSVETRRVDTCLACRGYVKTVAALTPAAAWDVAVLDLATVDLDVAAVARGFRRPAGPGAPLGARVITRARGWRRWTA